MPVATFEAFEVELQNTLYNLSDPLYTPEGLIFQVMDVQPSEGIEGIRRKIVDIIEGIIQREAESETGKIMFLYKVLYYRFVQSLSQERAAEVLDISARHLRRKQSEAIRALAARLWNRSLFGDPADQGNRPKDDLSDQLGEALRTEQKGATSWAEMVLHEIEVLNSQSPGIITTDLNRVVQKTIDMARFLHEKDGLSFETGPIPMGIEVAIHPTVLRQVILYVLQQAVQTGIRGAIAINAVDEANLTSLSFYIPNPGGQDSLALLNINELAQVLGGKVEIHLGDPCCIVDLKFPKSLKKVVLIVDDNPETIQLFRRYTTNSRFEIHHAPSGFELQQQIWDLKPDILVIDVLLPGQDGWDLLLQIRENPDTSRLPVIVSSVLGDPKIAHSLGANIYLPKPVDQKTFLRSLEEAAALA